MYLQFHKTGVENCSCDPKCYQNDNMSKTQVFVWFSFVKMEIGKSWQWLINFKRKKKLEKNYYLILLLPKLNVTLLFSTMKISWRYCTIIDGNWTEYKKLGCLLYFCTNFKKANFNINMQYIFNQKTFLQNIHPLSMYIVQEKCSINLSVCSINWNFRLNVTHFQVIHN